ncbi:MAG: DCC1-like thiol-disulfide oxidoreductase family protein [Proteobacteria bacterium]|nr:DCC1-like thiol-disulfide oxidoreductase family protein [Pseudomonadota bacterium]
MDTQNALSPGHPIIFFDGYCGLCNYFIDWVIRHDSAHRMRYASLQGATAQQIVCELGSSIPDSVILWQEGQQLVRSAAVAAILKSLGGPWRRIGSVLELIPTAVADRGYDFIARNRYSWFGKKDRCRLPSPAERHLFLE